MPLSQILYWTSFTAALISIASWSWNKHETQKYSLVWCLKIEHCKGLKKRAPLTWNTLWQFPPCHWSATASAWHVCRCRSRWETSLRGRTLAPSLGFHTNKCRRKLGLWAELWSGRVGSSRLGRQRRTFADLEKPLAVEARWQFCGWRNGEFKLVNRRVFNPKEYQLSNHHVAVGPMQGSRHGCVFVKVLNFGPYIKIDCSPGFCFNTSRRKN